MVWNQSVSGPLQAGLESEESLTPGWSDSPKNLYGSCVRINPVLQLEGVKFLLIQSSIWVKIYQVSAIRVNPISAPELARIRLVDKYVFFALKFLVGNCAIFSIWWAELYVNSLIEHFDIILSLDLNRACFRLFFNEWGIASIIECSFQAFHQFFMNLWIFSTVSLTACLTVLELTVLRNLNSMLDQPDSADRPIWISHTSRVPQLLV